MAPGLTMEQPPAELPVPVSAADYCHYSDSGSDSDNSDHSAAHGSLGSDSDDSVYLYCDCDGES